MALELARAMDSHTLPGARIVNDTLPLAAPGKSGCTVHSRSSGAGAPLGSTPADRQRR